MNENQALILNGPYAELKFTPKKCYLKSLYS